MAMAVMSATNSTPSDTGAQLVGALVRKHLNRVNKSMASAGGGSLSTPSTSRGGGWTHRVVWRKWGKEYSLARSTPPRTRRFTPHTRATCPISATG